MIQVMSKEAKQAQIAKKKKTVQAKLDKGKLFLEAIMFDTKGKATHTACQLSSKEIKALQACEGDYTKFKKTMLDNQIYSRLGTDANTAKTKQYVNVKPNYTGTRMAIARALTMPANEPNTAQAKAREALVKTAKKIVKPKAKKKTVKKKK